jgi:hypothetical protein
VGRKNERKVFQMGLLKNPAPLPHKFFSAWRFLWAKKFSIRQCSKRAYWYTASPLFIIPLNYLFGVGCWLFCLIPPKCT